MARGDVLQVAEPGHVLLERVAAGARTGARDGVGGLHDDRLDRARLHLADRPTQTIGRDARVLPGEGHGDAAAFVAAFRAAGWDGTLDVEIFSTPDAFWSLPADEAARRAFAAVSRFR